MLSALRIMEDLIRIKATTQILLESDMKGADNKCREYPERAMIASTGFIGTCYTCGEVGYRSSDYLYQGRHHSRHSTYHVACGAGIHADRRQSDRRGDFHQFHGGVRQGGARHDANRYGYALKEEDQRRICFADNGNDNVRHARAAPAIGYHRAIASTTQTCSPTTISSTAPLPPL
jgi:hypothetical protein